MLKSKEISNLVIFGIFVFVGLPRTFSFPDFVKKNGLNINGSHVCQNPVSKTINMKIIRQHEYKVRHNTTCSLKGWLWGSWKIPCVKTRIRLQNVYQLTVQKLYGYSLGCCHRWQKINQNDTECLKPICIHGCKHGKCVAGDKCHCEPGWRGYTCNQDINECYDNNGGCQHECHNTAGSHVCGCWRGYTPDANDTTKCSDINECKIPQPRCPCADQKCNATCVNTIGSFKCICPNGYRLNGLNNCIDVDECLSSFTNNCPHKCANTLGSFQCTCFKGFVYGKSRRCEDLNECADNNGGCEHKCLNVYGSSRCRCRRGYRLTPDRKKCRLFNYSLN